VARTQRPRLGEELLTPFRVLAGGEDLATAGAALLERACRALAAVEGVILLEEGGRGPGQGGFLPGPSWGPAGPSGRLGARPADRELATAAATAGWEGTGRTRHQMAAGRPLAAAPRPGARW